MLPDDDRPTDPAAPAWWTPAARWSASCAICAVQCQALPAARVASVASAGRMTCAGCAATNSRTTRSRKDAVPKAGSAQFTLLTLDGLSLLGAKPTGFTWTPHVLQEETTGLGIAGSADRPGCGARR
jgi:hypothetical protein